MHPLNQSYRYRCPSAKRLYNMKSNTNSFIPNTNNNSKLVIQYKKKSNYNIIVIEAQAYRTNSLMTVEWVD